MFRLCGFVCCARRPLFIGRSYSRDVSELDQILSELASLSKNDRLTALKILSIDNDERIDKFKAAVVRMAPKKKISDIESMLTSMRVDHVKNVSALKQVIANRQNLDKLLVDLVSSVHASVSGYLKCESIAQWLKLQADSTNRDKDSQRLETVLHISLNQLSELYESAISGKLSLQSKGLMNVVELCDNANHNFEREFTNELASSAGDRFAAQKVAVTCMLWKMQKKLQGEMYALEDEKAKNRESSL